MVVPIRDLGNKSVFYTSNIHSHYTSQLPTVFLSNNIGMDEFFAETTSNNYDEVRERTLSADIQSSRNSSVSFTKSLVIYHERMEHMNIDVDMNNVSSGLSYKITQKKAFRVSKVADTNNNAIFTSQQHGFYKHLSITLVYVDDVVINISLQYDSNALTESSL